MEIIVAAMTAAAITTTKWMSWHSQQKVIWDGERIKNGGREQHEKNVSFESLKMQEKRKVIQKKRKTKSTCCFFLCHNRYIWEEVDLLYTAKCHTFPHLTAFLLSFSRFFHMLIYRITLAPCFFRLSKYPWGIHSQFSFFSLTCDRQKEKMVTIFAYYETF